MFRLKWGYIVAGEDTRDRIDGRADELRCFGLANYLDCGWAAGLSGVVSCDEGS